MRAYDNRSREIIDIIGDVVKAASVDCQITVLGPDGCGYPMKCDSISYVFGDGEYIKDHLNELSIGISGEAYKLPMVALFIPFKEHRGNPDYYSKAQIRLIIACSTSVQWNNEQRKGYSFENVLRPIYRKMLEAMKTDGRLVFGADECVEHEYRENYSIGRYGAVAPSGEVVSEPIDAIEITNLKLEVRNFNCR